ncbi:MAG: ATP-binding cassette domain-containing protein, partial [Pseudomonadota bacterium]
MRVQLAGVGRHHGARTVLDRVTLAVGPRSRIGLVGPNGVGKSTLLRLTAGLEAPDAGAVVRSPSTLSVGYLPQEPDARPGESVLAYLARRTGVAAAEGELERRAAELARDPGAGDAYAAALDRFLALGGGDLAARAAATCAELGLGVELDRPTAALSGGESARTALAAILLSRFDVLLLDEPTNDLDFDGLARLERFLLGREGGLVVVSHDRALLDRVVTRIVEIDPWTHGIREWAGGWTAYAGERELARTRQYRRFDDAQERRRHVERLLAQRRADARAHGGAAGRRGTHALMTKVRQAERALERVDDVAKPYEP